MTEAKDKVISDNYQKALTAFGQAMKSFRKGDIEKTKELFSAFQGKYSTEKELIDRIGIYTTILEKKQLKKSEPLKTFDDYYQFGVYNLNQGELKEAEKLLTKAQQIEPNEAKIPYLLAIVALREEETDEALDLLTKAIELDEFFLILAQNEADFDSIREDENFQSIIGA